MDLCGGGCEDGESTEICIVAEPVKKMRGDSKYFCTVCNYGFTTKSNFSRHNRKKHDLKTEPKKPVSEETISHSTFHSTEDFLEWKLKVERDTLSNFVAKRGPKSRRNGDVVRYYNCHRSGHYIPRGSGKKPLKVAGSNKIGANCTANIKTVTKNKEDGVEINVTFQPLHTGHVPEVRRLALSKPEKEVIAAQLQLGVPMDRILKNIGDNFSPNKRVSFLSRKDLHNIAATYGIDCNKVVDPNEYLASEVDDQMQVTELVINQNEAAEGEIGQIEVTIEKMFEERKADLQANLQHLMVQVDNCASEEELNMFETLVSEIHLNLEAIRTNRGECSPSTSGLAEGEPAVEEAGQECQELGDVVIVSVDNIAVLEGTWPGVDLHSAT